MPAPLFVSKLSPEQWAEARHLRAEGAPFRDIAQRFDIGASTVANRARREGWPLPATMPASIGVAHPAGAVRRPSPATLDIRRRLALRLWPPASTTMPPSRSGASTGRIRKAAC